LTLGSLGTSQRGQELEFQRLAAELEDEHEDLRAQALRPSETAETAEMSWHRVVNVCERWVGVSLFGSATA